MSQLQLHYAKCLRKVRSGIREVVRRSSRWSSRSRRSLQFTLYSWLYTSSNQFGL